MRRLRVAALAASCGTVIVTPFFIAGLAGSSSSQIGPALAVPTADHRTVTVTANFEPVNTAQTTTISKTNIAEPDPAVVADTGALAQPMEHAAVPVPEPAPVNPPDATALASLTPENSQSAPGEVGTASAPAVHAAQGLDELCGETEACIDEYLWSLYERAPKVNTVKETEKKKVTVEKNGKSRTITKTETKLVAENFAWKDPHAAEKAGMSVKDYVIGGMDRGFKLRLYRALRALDRIGLSPGITSAFRDDYRQSLASGLHAASNRSYHGGSLRGGYGHGLAADVVSVKGDTSAERWAASEQLWKWIDAQGKEFGIGRPYLNKDPGHCAPLDGAEYAAHHAKALAQQTHPDSKKHHKLAAHDNHKVASTTIATSREPQDRR